MRLLPGASLWLGVALAAGGALLALPAPDAGRPSVPAPASVAWAGAQRGTVPATLADGSSYQPRIFLDAHSSVGTAETPDNKSLRLVLIGSDAPVRELRRLPLTQNPSFQAFTISGDLLAWAEGTDSGHPRLWTAGLRDAAAPRELTADTGRAAFYQSEYDLVIAEGRLHWVANGPARETELRSVALTGGPVEVRTEAGTWALSAWPWQIDGVDGSAGTTTVRNITTGRTVAVANSRKRSTVDCSPTWCRVVSLSAEGLNQIELMRPDGSDRKRIAGDDAATAIADVAPLDRFELVAALGPVSDQTGTTRLLAYEISSRRTVEISPAAQRVFYNAGVLWWSTGNLEAVVWHSIDLRTV